MTKRSLQLSLTSQIGLAMIVLSNPLLYLMVGVTMIDVKNIFGSSIDRQSISFDTNDPFIQAMTFKGSDQLAGIAATAQPIKTTAFLTSFFGLLTALLIRRMTRRSA